MTESRDSQANRYYQEMDHLLLDGGKLAALSEEKRFSLYESCINFLTCYCFGNELSSSQSGADGSFSLGGRPENSANWPLDKASKPMAYLGRVDSTRLLPDQSLQIFLSTNFQEYSAKDRSWFEIVSERGFTSSQSPDLDLDDVDILPELKLGSNLLLDTYRYEELIKEATLDGVKNELKSLLQKYNQELNPHLSAPAIEEMLAQHREARQRAAFYANGISFSDKRALDSHYKHLIDDSKNWLVFLKIRENSILKLTSNRDILLLINKNNFQNGNFEKGSLVIF